MREILGWLVAAALVIALVSTYAPWRETISGDVRVIDGDSLRVGTTEVRLFGVDAFEGRQVCVRDGSPWRCGEAAADELGSSSYAETRIDESDGERWFCTEEDARRAGCRPRR